MKRILLLLMILTVFLFSACNQEPPLDVPSLKSVVVGIPQDFDSLDPHRSVATGTQEVMLNLFSGLITITLDGEIINDLAEEIEVSEDLMTYTVKLKQPVKFHNDQAMTSKDVAYTFNRLNGRTEDQPDPLTANFNAIESIETPDDETVIFKMNRVDVAFLSKLMIAIIPEGSGPDQAKEPIGAGPFKFDGYTAGVGIDMLRHDNYHGTLPELEKVEFKIYTDANTGFLALQVGEVDILNLTLDQTYSVDQSKITVLTAPQNMVQLITLNFEFEPFQNLKVRQALNHAINKEEIIEMLAPGSPQLDTNYSPIMGYYYNKDTEDYYDYNPDKAKELLKAAGYEDLTFSLKVPTEYPFHVDTALLLQAQLENVGVNMKLLPIEWNTWLSEVYESALYEASIIGLTGKLDPDTILNRFETTFLRNFYNYSNSYYDDLIEQARKTADPEERREIYREAQMILTEEAVAIFIMDPTLYRAVNNRLSGLHTYPIGFIDMSTVKIKD